MTPSTRRTATTFTLVASPIGPILLTCEGTAGTLAGLFTDAQRDSPMKRDDWKEDARGFDQAIRELEEYFAGTRRAFEVALETSRGTEFQRAVWTALRAIPYGETVSYADVATSVGRPRAVRAVGAAVGMNPWGIIVPCHRVVGSAGALTGFAGGLARKRWLLEHEGIRVVGGRDHADPLAKIAGRQLTL